jgi:ATP synthase protein I
VTGPERDEAARERPETAAEEIRRRAERKRRAREEGRRPVWFGLGMFGLVGWAVAVPTLAGVALGLWLDSRSGGGSGWTLALLVAGVGLGCINALWWVSRESKGD